MSEKSKIEWTDATWNPVTGCTKISEGCQNCYAIRMAARLGHMSIAHELANGGDPGPLFSYKNLTFETRDGYDWTGKINLHDDRLDQPLRWRKPRRIFVCSMSDLFHQNVPFSFVNKIFGKIAVAQDHTFIILTKRPERMKKYINSNWGNQIHGGFPNLWLGVTAENQKQADKRIPILLEIQAAVRLVNIEPMLGPVDRNDYLMCKQYAGPEKTLTNCIPPQKVRPARFRPRLDWVIVGGESGPGARPMHPDWVRSVRDQCQAAQIPFFFKQWGEWQNGSSRFHRNRLILNNGSIYEGSEHISKFDRNNWEQLNPTRISKVGKKKAGCLLDGRTYKEYPRRSDV